MSVELAAMSAMSRRRVRESTALVTSGFLGWITPHMLMAWQARTSLPMTSGLLIDSMFAERMACRMLESTGLIEPMFVRIWMTLSVWARMLLTNLVHWFRISMGLEFFKEMNTF